MSSASLILNPAQPLVAGSFGNIESLLSTPSDLAAEACDLVEIRLDLLGASGARPWSHLADLLLLFTARRGDEGGEGNLSAAQRMDLLEMALPEASAVDVELVSAGEMNPFLELTRSKGIPWIASWHDFEGRDDSFSRIPGMAEEAAEAGAACFKAAVRLHGMEDLVRLAELLTRPLPLPLSLMGMGPLAPVSRLLCAQYGSVLNYGFLGNAPTAPGQWDAKALKAAIRQSATGLR